jgi:RND family efflux transporter MFP subunit
MTALVNGQIDGMLVQKGDKVKAGQVLAFFDKREADALVEKTAAVVAREKQAVNEAKRKYKRIKEISVAGNASEQARENSEAEFRAAKAHLQVAIAEHRIAKINREKLSVTAPWDGVIIEKTAEQGQWVEAGIKLFTLVAEKGHEIEANVDAGDSGVVKIGQVVTLTCDAFPNYQWQETIHWISPAIRNDKDSVLNSFAVRMTLGKDAPALLLGQQVDVNIRTAYREDTLTLPYNALIDDVDTTQVAVVRDGQVNYQPITVGIESFTHIEITEGVSESDNVILSNGTPPPENHLVTIKSAVVMP